MTEQHQPEVLGYVIGFSYKGMAVYFEEAEVGSGTLGMVEHPLEAYLTLKLEDATEGVRSLTRLTRENPDVQNVRAYALQLVPVESEGDDE